MNFIGFVLSILGSFCVRRARLRPLVMNDAYVKLMIITGALKWHDVPHLHHPLISLKIDLEYRREIKWFMST